jgi:hypothetical protein
VALGALIVFAVFARKSAPSPAAPIVFSATPPAPVAPKTHHVKVSLPFVSTLVTFDDTARELEPAADSVDFEVSDDKAPRHRIIAVALDGTRAEGWVNEVDGVAKIEDDGYTFESPDLPTFPQPTSTMTSASRPQAQRPSPAPRKPAPVGTTKNGFTKLK